MKAGFHVVEKTQDYDEAWVWLCCDANGDEWATYVSRENDPDATVLGHYFRSENECNETRAREDYEQRQHPPQPKHEQESEPEADTERESEPYIEHLGLLDTEYADIIVNSAHPGIELSLRRLGVEAGEARHHTTWFTVLSKQPKTQEEQDRWFEAWQEMTGRPISTEEFAALSKLLWGREDDSVF